MATARPPMPKTRAMTRRRGASWRDRFKFTKPDSTRPSGRSICLTRCPMTVNDVPTALLSRGGWDQVELEFDLVVKLDAAIRDDRNGGLQQPRSVDCPLVNSDDPKPSTLVKPDRTQVVVRGDQPEPRCCDTLGRSRSRGPRALCRSRSRAVWNRASPPRGHRH